jgi:agmatinase
MIQEKRFVPLNFAGLHSELSSWENSKVVIIPVPYDLTTSYLPGTRQGPLAIIEASTHMELFDDELQKEPASIGIHTLDQLGVITSGPQKMIKRIEEAVSWVIQSDKYPVLLGGEHSITLGAVNALKNKYTDFNVVQFDAHADLRDEFQGSKFNHACVGRRIHEICKLTQIGIRSLCKEEFDYLTQSDIDTYFAQEILEDKNRIEDMVKKLPSQIYITIDLDVFDPAIMPSVGTPEPGGLGWYPLVHILKLLGDRKNILGFDIVELCPCTATIAPNFLAAKLCYKLLGYIHCDSSEP